MRKACIHIYYYYADAQKPKGRRVIRSGINVSLALALRGITGAYHGETDRGPGVTCLTNPLKTPPKDTVHVNMQVWYALAREDVATTRLPSKKT